MKAMPIAEFLARKSGEAAAAASARAEPPKLAPTRKVSPVNDDDDPGFRRSGLVAALARRSPEGHPLVRPLASANLPRRETAHPPAVSAPEPAPAREDVEARLSEAYHRGVQEGLDAAKSEAATARALERAEMQKRAVVEKLDFQMNEYARLAEALNAGFAELERRVAQSAAQLLKPLVEENVAKQIVEELAENVGRLARADGAGLLKVKGPERLLSALKAKIGPMAVAVEYTQEEGVEISVAAQATEIRSALGDWRRLIDEIVEHG